MPSAENAGDTSGMGVAQSRPPIFNTAANNKIAAATLATVTISVIARMPMSLNHRGRPGATFFIGSPYRVATLGLR